MWATLETWLLGDGEVAELGVGDVLRRTGLRLSCQTFRPGTETGCATTALRAAADGDPTYRLRGSVVAAWRQAAVIDVGTCRILLEPEAVRTVQTADGHDALERFSADFETVPVGAAGEAVGRLQVVPGYEWDAFHQLDARRDWHLQGVLLVQRQARFSDDDVLVDGIPGRVTRLERLDVAADLDPRNQFLVDLEPTRDVGTSGLRT